MLARNQPTYRQQESSGTIDYNWYWDDEGDFYVPLSLQWSYTPEAICWPANPDEPAAVEVVSIKINRGHSFTPLTVLGEGWIDRLFFAMYEDRTDHSFRDEIDGLLWKAWQANGDRD